ncbi:MAG TPA: hypothetical protein PLS11_13270 [Ottowia sp.]|nr:hypothetical protein [Ottowia sp.]
MRDIHKDDGQFWCQNSIDFGQRLWVSLTVSLIAKRAAPRYAAGRRA